MKIGSILKGIWNLLPLAFFINLLSRLLIVGAVLSYLGSIGDVSFLIKLILNLWALIPLYYSVRRTYFEIMGNQNPTTLLWNSLDRSIHNLDKATKKRIIAKKQRIWVERNPEINLLNYWFLKYFRKNEWMNIDVEEKEEVLK